MVPPVSTSFSERYHWFLSGDFNDIINNEEKQGGPQRPEGSFTNFRSFLSKGDLYDLKHSGDPLSWRGVRNTHVVRCLLDRAIANISWAELFPSARCDYLNFEGSDHKPIISYFELEKRKRKCMFRFDRRLRENTEVKELVDKTWNKEAKLSLEYRLSRIRWAIIQWTKEQRLNSKVQIEKLKIDLEEAMVSPLHDDLLLKSINSELLKAYKKRGRVLEAKKQNPLVKFGR